MKKLLTMILVLGSFSAWGQCTDANLAAWSESDTNGGEIAVTSGAALSGSCGLSVVYLSASGKGLVGDENATNEQRFRAAMLIDPNSIVLPLDGVGGKVKMHNAQCTAGTCANNGIVQFKVQSDGASAYEIRGYVRDSNSNATKNKWTVPLVDGCQSVQYDLDITAGTFKLWVDATSEGDTPVVDLSGLDMAAWSGGVSRARIGSLSNPANVTPGSDKEMFVDEYESRRQTFITQSCAP